MANRAVILNSGGIDSRVAAAMLHSQGWELHSLYHDWTLHVRDAQRRAAQITADAYCVSHEEVAWPNPDWVIWDENLGKWCLPHTTYHSAMLGSIYAVTKGVEWIATGARSDSAHATWKEHFQELLNDSIFYHGKVLLTPLWDMHQSDITRMAGTLDVDLNSTWSCPNSDPQCGECASCLRRMREGIRL